MRLTYQQQVNLMSLWAKGCCTGVLTSVEGLTWVLRVSFTAQVATDALVSHERRCTLLPQKAAERCRENLKDDGKEIKGFSSRRVTSSLRYVTMLLTLVLYPCYAWCPVMKMIPEAASWCKNNGKKDTLQHMWLGNLEVNVTTVTEWQWSGDQCRIGNKCK